MRQIEPALKDDEVPSQGVYEALFQRDAQSRTQGRLWYPPEEKFEELYEKLLSATGPVSGQAQRFAHEMADRLKHEESARRHVARGAKGDAPGHGRKFAGDTRVESKLVKIQKAQNQIVVDYEGNAKRPSDSELLVSAIQIHQQRPGTHAGARFAPESTQA